MAPGNKTYEEKLEGIRNLSMNTKLRRLKIEQAQKAAKAEAEALRQSHKAKASAMRKARKNPFANPASQPITFAQPADPWQNASLNINDTVVFQAYETRDDMPTDSPVGKLAFCDGIAYIMTRQGWSNLGEKMSHPEPMTDRRGAIAAQKARRRNEGLHKDAKAR